MKTFYDQLNLAFLSKGKFMLLSKKLRVTLLFTFLLISNYSFSQGRLTFDNFPLTNTSYQTQIPSWQGDGGITWNLSAGAKGKSITGITPLFGTNGKKAKPKHGILTSSLITGGIGSLQFNYAKAFSRSGEFIVSINDVEIEKFVVNNSLSNVLMFTTDINISGDFILKIESTERLLLDDIEWTGFGGNLPKQPSLVLSLSENSVNENSSSLSLTATLSETFDTPVLINFNIEGSASAISDYNLSSQQISIPANELSSSLQVNIVNDEIGESDENIFFSIANLSQSIVYDKDPLVLNIIDDDNVSPINTVHFVNAKITVKESDSPLEVEVSIDEAISSPFNISISCQDNDDITSYTKEVHFEANSTTASMNIIINDDDIEESTEIYSFTISHVDNDISIGNNNVFSLEILDDDKTVSSNILENYVFLNPNLNPQGEIIVNLTPKEYVSTVTTSEHMLSVRIPDSYYDAAIGLTGDNLRSSISTIISSGAKSLSYRSVWDMCEDADQNPKNPSQVWQMYLEEGISKSAHVSGNSGWNREHTWAKSHGGFGTSAGRGTDGHHLRATDARKNSNRGSRDFSNSAPGYTPPKSARGDVARMIMYMAVRWNMSVDNNCKQTETSARHGKLSDLLKWHEEDPVDPYEIRRNNVICYKYQSNRNPFIDHPELVQYIFGDAKADTWTGGNLIKPTGFKLLSSLEDFGMIKFENESDIQTFSFSATELTEDISVDAPKDIFISTDGINFSSTLSLKPTKGSLSATNISVKYIPSSSSGEILNARINISSGDKSIYVLVNASEGDSSLILQEIYSFDFNTENTAWTQYSVSSNQDWHYSTSKDQLQGRNSVGMAMNNYSGDSSSEDWLISPLFDFSAASNLSISYWLNSKYSGSNLEVLYSEDFSGTGNPNTFTWHSLKTENPLPNSWSESNINFPSGKTNIYFAFKHTSGKGKGNSSSLCIDDFSISGLKTPMEGLLTSSIDLLVFPYTEANAFSPAENFVLSFDKLKGDILISSDGDFQFAKDDFVWAASLSISKDAASGQNINVRYAPENMMSTATHSNIYISAEGAESTKILLTTQANPDIADANLLDKSETLDVVSWNIEWFGAPSKSKHASDFNTQLEKVSSKIIELNADVYALQELVTDDLNGDFLTPLIDKLNLLAGSNRYKGILGPRYSHDDSEPTSDFPAQRLSYIYDTNTVDDISNFSMFSDLYAGSSTTEIENYTGLASKFWASGRTPFMFNADITINGARENIKFVNIHAKCCSNSYDRKLADAKFLLHELITNYSDDNIILLGDYNDFLSGSMSGGNESPYKDFFNTNDNFKAVFTSSTNIDHIAISNELYDENDILLNNTIETDVSISDHKPIMLRLKFNSFDSEIKLLGSIADYDYVDVEKGDFIAQEQNVILKSTKLTGNVHISLSEPFQFSINNIDWLLQADISKEEAADLEFKIRFNPKSTYSDKISSFMYIKSDGARTIKANLNAYGKPDVLAPEFSDNFPVINYIGSSNIRIDLKLNEKSTVYYSVLSAGSTAPSIDDLLSKTNIISGSAEAGTEITSIEINGLKINTSYDIYFIAKDKSEPIVNIQKSYVTLNLITKNHILLPFEYISTISRGEHISNSNIPTSYYADAYNNKGAELKSELKRIINEGFISYPYEETGRGDVAAADRRYVKKEGQVLDVYDIMDEADSNPNDPTKVYMIYKECSYDMDAKHLGRTGSKEKWNREHVYPQSTGGFKNARAPWGSGPYANGNVIVNAGDNVLLAQSDAHHLRSSDKNENARRSNLSFTAYTPPLSAKGDVARVIFYLNLRYNLDISKLGSVDMFREWSELDPVDPYEIRHNNVVYKYQKNRNPFIDHPELIDYVYGNKNTDTWNSAAKKVQTISFAAIEDKTLGDESFELSAVSDSGLAITYEVSGAASLNGSTLSLTGLGMVTITANQSGDDEFLSAKSVEQSFEVNNITGIEDELNSEIIVYPIPTNDYVIVKIPNLEVKTIYVLNTKGQILFKTKASYQVTIPLMNYKNGIYFIRIGVNKDQTYKIIKQ